MTTKTDGELDAIKKWLEENEGYYNLHPNQS